MSAILKLKTINGRPVLRGIDHVWSVILDLTRGGATFTRHDVDQRCCDPADNGITDYLRRLVRAGILAEVGTEPAHGRRRGRRIYRLVQRHQEAPRLRRDGSQAPTPANQLMWNTMRNLLRDGFTAHELATFAATDEVTVPVVTAQSYVKHLAGAGYLIVLQKSVGSRPAKWRLKPSMVSGPLAPKLLRTHVVYDPNTEALHGPAEVVAEEVTP
ncbi:hypothetical protein [Stappia sp. TSB10P1A]|uniref:hypothetical protein n=1 Tax=Stappia sp. TSB10P1A TaxID=2003585 RepID=UPI00164373B6|nr:hypothetical protein [Stappia sp. TSB10P1A]